MDISSPSANIGANSSSQKKMIICFSGIKMANRGDGCNPSAYREMTQSLGCEYTTNMNVKTVSYLVVGKVGMDKHIAALRYNIPCVTVSCQK
jgi:hypothetical protein